MKIKVLPEDFQVRERLDLSASPASGAYRLYRLAKRGWNTLDAIAAAARANNVPLSAIGYGGKKDRHALTEQFLSVPSRYRLDFDSKNVSVIQEGFIDDYLSPFHLLGNEFILTIRDLSEPEARTLESGLERVSRWGFANYFDDQRFGSVSEGTFLAERLIRGEYAGALQLFFCTIHPEDPAPVKALKTMRRKAWPDWNALVSLSRTREEREIARLLSRDASRGGLIRALNLIPREELSMAFSAFQSFLWNLALSRLVRLYGKDPFEVPGRVAPTLHFKSLEPEGANPLRGLEIPTEAAKILPAEPRVQEVMDEILHSRRIRRPQFNMREFRRTFFKSFPRRAVSKPENPVFSGFEPDELYPGKWRATLGFFLPKSSYATMLLKAMTGKN
jgi:tRNA pseudouridine13 synthase